MYISDEDVLFLLGMVAWFVSLGICLILIWFKSFRRRDNVLAWLVWSNLLAGLLYAAHFPAIKAQDLWFARADPHYTVAPEVADIRSIYFPDLQRFEKAAYVCYGGYSETVCDFPIGDVIASGKLSFIETGADPVIRYEIHYGEAACLQDRQADGILGIGRGPFRIEPALGICVLGREVETVSATHEFRTQHRQQSFPSRRDYVHAELIDRRDNSVLAQLDGWDGASPYLRDEIWEPRRPDGALGHLLRIPPHRNDGYDRGKVDDLMAQHGFDEGILMRAANSTYQSYRADALWLACRAQLSDSISPQNKEILREMSRTVFVDSPDWIYPESCPVWAR